MKRTLLFLIVFVLSSLLLAQNVRKSQVRKAEIRPFDQGLNAGSEFSLNRWPAKTVNMLDNNRALQKISMSSSLNVNGLFVYEQRYVSIRPEAGTLNTSSPSTRVLPGIRRFLKQPILKTTAILQ
jgi:hypothetical protein